MNHYALIWLIILSTTALIYVINDGSALGLSVFLPWANEVLQKKILSLLLPIWDANQTWLVFTLAGLYGGFSLGFSVIMTTLYLPMIILLILLICRGASIEYAMKSGKKIWLYSLSLFSLAIIVTQALVITLLLNSLMNSAVIAHSYKFYINYVLGMLVYLLFMLQLGLSNIDQSWSRSVQLKLLITFTVLFAFFAFLYEPLHYFISSWFIVLSSAIIFIQKYTNKLFNFALVSFAIANILVVMFFNFPNVFPDQLTYLAAASSNDSLKFMIRLSAIMLPILFIIMTYFRHYFRNKLHDIYY